MQIKFIHLIRIITKSSVLDLWFGLITSFEIFGLWYRGWFDRTKDMFILLSPALVKQIWIILHLTNTNYIINMHVFHKILIKIKNVNLILISFIVLTNCRAETKQINKTERNRPLPSAKIGIINACRQVKYCCGFTSVSSVLLPYFWELPLGKEHICLCLKTIDMLKLECGGGFSAQNKHSTLLAGLPEGTT